MPLGLSLTAALLLLLSTVAWAGPAPQSTPNAQQLIESEPSEPNTDTATPISDTAQCSEPAQADSTPAAVGSQGPGECQSDADCDEVCAEFGHMNGGICAQSSGGGVCFCF